MSVLRSAKLLLERVGISAWRSRLLPFGIEMSRDVARLCEGAPPSMIFDVGGNVGRITLLLKQRFPDSTIHVFEPVPEVYQKLSQAVRDTPGVTAHRLALGAEAGDATIYVAPQSPQSSLVRCEALDDERRPETVRVDTLDGFCEKRGIERIDPLKIDTEGYELEVLKGASRALSEGRVRLVHAECEFERISVEPHGNFFALYEYLRPLGFHLVTFYTDSTDRRGMRYGNALFAHQATQP